MAIICEFPDEIDVKSTICSLVVLDLRAIITVITRINMQLIIYFLVFIFLLTI